MDALPIRHCRRIAIALVGAAFLAALAGCGNGQDGTAAKTGRPLVPGGSKLTARDGAPDVCAQLTGAPEILALGEAVTGWAQHPPVSGSAEQLLTAADRLSQLSDDAEDDLAPALRSAAHAIDNAAQAKPTARSVQRLATTLQRLGRKLEGPCGYPVG